MHEPRATPGPAPGGKPEIGQVSRQNSGLIRLPCRPHHELSPWAQMQVILILKKGRKKEKREGKQEKKPACTWKICSEISGCIRLFGGLFRSFGSSNLGRGVRWQDYPPALRSPVAATAPRFALCDKLAGPTTARDSPVAAQGGAELPPAPPVGGFPMRPAVLLPPNNDTRYLSGPNSLVIVSFGLFFPIWTTTWAHKVFSSKESRRRYRDLCVKLLFVSSK